MRSRKAKGKRSGRLSCSCCSLLFTRQPLNSMKPLVSTRVSIAWPPAAAYEDTDTLVSPRAPLLRSELSLILLTVHRSSKDGQASSWTCASSSADLGRIRLTGQARESSRICPNRLKVSSLHVVTMQELIDTPQRIRKPSSTPLSILGARLPLRQPSLLHLTRATSPLCRIRTYSRPAQ